MRTVHTQAPRSSSTVGRPAGGFNQTIFWIGDKMVQAPLRFDLADNWNVIVLNWIGVSSLGVVYYTPFRWELDSSWTIGALVLDPRTGAPYVIPASDLSPL